MVPMCIVEHNFGQLGGWGDQTDYGFKKAPIGYLQLQKLSSQNYLYLLSKKL